MINKDFLQEILTKPTPEDLNVYKRMGLDSYTSPTGTRYPTADYFNPPKTSSINRDFVDSLALDEHPDVTESKLPPMADPDKPLTHFADPVPPTGIPDIVDPQGLTGDIKPPVSEDPIRAIKQLKGLARGAENVVGTVGSMAQWVAERATIGNILTRHTDLPYGAGVVAEYLVRKFGPKKPMEFFDKQMTKYAKQGEKWADYWEEQSQKGWEAPDPEVTQAKWRDMPITKGIATISEAAPNYLAAIASSVLTKSPQTGLLFISALSGAGQYRRQRKAGAGVAKANAIATLTMAWEYITEKIPFDEVFKPAKSTFLKMLKLGTLESAQEFVQGIGENFLEYFGYKAKDLKSVPAAVKEGLEHTMDGWVENVVAGAGLGVIGGGIVPKGGLIKAPKPPHTEVIPAPEPPSKPITPEIPPVTPTVAEAEAVEAGEEDWEKTREEFRKSEFKKLGISTIPFDWSREYRTGQKLDKLHKLAVKQAYQQGKSVPAEVLAEYPELAQPVAKAEAVEVAPEVEEPRTYKTRTGKIVESPTRLYGDGNDLTLAELRKMSPDEVISVKRYSAKRGGVARGKIKVGNLILPETLAQPVAKAEPAKVEKADIAEYLKLKEDFSSMKFNIGSPQMEKLRSLERSLIDADILSVDETYKAPSDLKEKMLSRLEAEPTKVVGKKADAEFIKDRWDNSKLGYRVELVMRGKWITNKGQITKSGEKYAQSKWDELSPAVQNVVRKFIAQDYNRQLPELKAEQVKPKGKRVISEESYQKAKKRLTDRTTLRMGVEPQGFADLVTIGAYHIENGLRTFAAWSKKMIEVYGESVKPQLKKIWAQVRPLSAEEVEAFPKEFLTEQQRTKAEMGEIPSEGEYKSQSETFNVHLDYFQKRQLPKTSRIPKIQARIRTINGQRLAGKVSAKAANKAIIALREHLIETAIDEGIALRMTRGGKISLSVRKAGTYVPEEFAQYEFKNIRPILGGGQDITRAIQQMDGSLSLKGKLREKGQAGPLERHVLWPTRDISIQKLNYIKEKTAELKSIFKTKKGTKEDEQINRILEQIAKEDRATPIKDILSRKTLRALASSKIIQQAIQLREFYDNVIEEQNLAREMRDQDTIPYRHNYSPHILRDATIWERLMMTGKKPKDIKADLPDYIKPNAPFNPRAMAREAGIPYDKRVKSAQELAESYLVTASKDIFNTSIVQNNKAFIQQLESMGYDKSANYLADWTAEAYAGVKPRGDRWLSIGRKAEKSARYFNKLRNMAVFPFNFSWSLLTQTSSLALTVGRYGTTNTMMGFVQWLNPKIRKQAAENYYSYIVKSEKQGRITRQDAENLIGQRVKLRRTSTEIAIDISTLLLDQLEKLLTGTSIRAAHLHGQKRGLTGEALRNYASDGGAKTQSMYNDEDKPGILRTLLVKTGLPFQTFNYEVMNTLREWAGKTGTPPDTKLYTIWTIIRFLAAAAVFSAIGKKWGNKEIWSWKRPPIPFAELWLSPIIRMFNNEYIGRSGSGLISPVETAQRVAKGIKDVLETGSWRKLRNELIKYGPGILHPWGLGVPGGVQISRTVDAIIAYAQGGVKDRKGRLLFEMEDPQDLVQAIFSGVWSTEGGRAYLDIDYRIKNMTPKELRQYRKDNVYQKTRVVKLKDGTKIKQKKDQPHKGREKLVEKIEKELEKRE